MLRDLSLVCCSLFIFLLLLPAGSVVLAADPLAEDPHAAGEPHHPEGPIEWDSDLALWSLVSFLIILALLAKFAWAPLSDGLNKREGRIRQDIAAAEAARRKAEAMLAEYEGRLEAVQGEVREILAEARRDADVARQNIIADAQREAAATQRRAVEEIERAKQQALKELADTLAADVALATEHILGRTVNDQDQDRLIEEALTQLAKQSS